MSAEPQYHVAHLAEPGAVAEADLGRVFAAAWERIAHLRLAPGEGLERSMAASEAMVFVLAGSGTASLGEVVEELREGISVTYFQGEPLAIEAGDAGLDLFLAELGVGS